MQKIVIGGSILPNNSFKKPLSLHHLRRYANPPNYITYLYLYQKKILRSLFPSVGLESIFSFTMEVANNLQANQISNYNLLFTFLTKLL